MYDSVPDAPAHSVVPGASVVMVMVAAFAPKLPARRMSKLNHSLVKVFIGGGLGLGNLLKYFKFGLKYHC